MSWWFLAWLAKESAALLLSLPILIILYLAELCGFMTCRNTPRGSLMCATTEHNSNNTISLQDDQFSCPTMRQLLLFLRHQRVTYVVTPQSHLPSKWTCQCLLGPVCQVARSNWWAHSQALFGRQGLECDMSSGLGENTGFTQGSGNC
jgi:hypothetical protein